jgi:phosphate transport system substrate-binding protein
MKDQISSKLIVILTLLFANFAFPGERITVAGSTTVKPIADMAAVQFKQKHPGVDLMVGAGGSGRGISLISQGAVSIGMSSRPLKPEEQAGDLVIHKIGLDGVVLVANSSNPVTTLTRQQVQDIYTGKIANWKELGGADAPISLCALNSDHGTNEVFLNYFALEGNQSGTGSAMVTTFRKAGEGAYSAIHAKTIADHRGVLADVMTNGTALGYVSIGQAMQVVSKGAQVRLLELDGVAPSLANVRSGAYTFSRPLLVIVKSDASKNVREFVDFLSGPEGQAIVSKMDYVPWAQ